MSVLADEQAKYAEIWTFPQYRQHSPGEIAVERFLKVINYVSRPQRDGWDLRECVWDLGCGEGRGSVALDAKGFRVFGRDFVDVRSQEGAAAMSVFTCAALWDWKPSESGADYGYCVDVLEHVPTEFTMLSISKMTEWCGKVYLEIATEPDAMGALIGQPLHLTVQPFTWWRDRLREIANVLDARDLMGKAAFLVEAK